MIIQWLDDKGQSVQDDILQAGGRTCRRYASNRYKISEDITLCLKDISCLLSFVNLIYLLYKEI